MESPAINFRAADGYFNVWDCFTLSLPITVVTYVGNNGILFDGFRISQAFNKNLIKK